MTPTSSRSGIQPSRNGRECTGVHTVDRHRLGISYWHTPLDLGALMPSPDREALKLDGCPHLLVLAPAYERDLCTMPIDLSSFYVPEDAISVH
jgi:hypothetical protein